MRIEVFKSEEPYLLVKAAGQFSLQEAKRTFLEVLSAAEVTRSTHVLFDGREITGEVGLTDRFYYGAFVAEETIRLAKNRLRFAYVLKEPILDPKKFGEIVASNRGMFVKSFADFDEAINWLTQ